MALGCDPDMFYVPNFIREKCIEIRFDEKYAERYGQINKSLHEKYPEDKIASDRHYLEMRKARIAASLESGDINQNTGVLSPHMEKALEILANKETARSSNMADYLKKIANGNKKLRKDGTSFSVPAVPKRGRPVDREFDITVELSTDYVKRRMISNSIRRANDIDPSMDVD